MKFSFHHRKVKKKTLISSIQNDEIIIFLFTKRKQGGVYEEKKASFRTWRRLLIRALPSRKYKTMPYPTTSTIAHTIGCTTKQKNMFSSPSQRLPFQFAITSLECLIGSYSFMFVLSEL